MPPSLALVVAFLCGSIPFGYLAGRLKGTDVRTAGSGNIGATNVWRLLGWKVGLPVFILDVAKGLVPVLIASASAAAHPDSWASSGSLLPVLAALAAILGHSFTPWLRFRGGKGVATSAGVLIGLMPIVFLVALATWAALFLSTRYVALASVAASIAVPLTIIATSLASATWDPPLLVFGTLVTTIVTVRHRSNLRRLANGTEPKMHGRKAPPPSGPDSDQTPSI
jgi:acyl phosphate:glycerol-3-phosphate acyltransferase